MLTELGTKEGTVLGDIRQRLHRLCALETRLVHPTCYLHTQVYYHSEPGGHDANPRGHYI